MKAREEVFELLEELNLYAVKDAYSEVLFDKSKAGDAFDTTFLELLKIQKAENKLNRFLSQN